MSTAVQTKTGLARLYQLPPILSFGTSFNASVRASGVAERGSKRQCTKRQIAGAVSFGATFSASLGAERGPEDAASSRTGLRYLQDLIFFHTYYHI